MPLPFYKTKVMENTKTYFRKGCSLKVLLSRHLMILSFLSWLPSYLAGQTIEVNADGTQTLIMDMGSYPYFQINPDGTHTLIYDNGCTQTWVNPDGTHSVMLNANTQISVLVNPDGTHTSIFRNGNIEIRNFPDGTSKTYFISEPFITEISSTGPPVHPPINTSKKSKNKHHL